MKRFWIVLPIALFVLSCSDQKESAAPEPPFLKSATKDSTPTYEEGMAFWEQMANHYDEIEMFSYGETDAGLPLHVVIIDGERPRPIGAYKQGTKQVILINNAIHAGEPDGVDASMILAHQLMTEQRFKKLLENTTVCIIPFYNIGGVLNRNTSTRANQNGPAEYGFRGNAQNLDLNRDFIKCDSRNALTFATLVNELDPDLYIETHVSNGADYQYTLTYLSTQEDKLDRVLGEAMRNRWTPFVVDHVRKAGFKVSPYVNVHGQPPDNGFTTFYDSPRYSTGSLALRQTPGYITETHMLKPYAKRVESTLEFLMGCVKLSNQFPIRRAVDESRKRMKEKIEFALDWTVDSSEYKTLTFEGYVAKYKPSVVTGSERLFYNRNEPFLKEVKYFNRMKPTTTVTAPEFYILRRGFVDVEDRLRTFGVKLTEVEKDTLMTLETYRIKDYKTSTSVFEKHYAHTDVIVDTLVQQIQIRKGDWMIMLDNLHRRFLVEVLEPFGPDSYFRWNFFDAILQQKEWYSSYVFEDEAAEMLNKNQELKIEFETKKASDSAFKDNPRAQLYWLYTHSNHYEKEHLLYPVYRGIEGC